MKTQKQLLSFFTALTLASATGAFAQTPANDDFANRTVLGGSSISFGGSLAGATLESNEPAYYPSLTNGVTGSLWWTWTAPVSTTLTMWFSSTTSPRTLLTLYSGTNISALTPINYTWGPAGRYMAFNVTAGTAYQIQVLGDDTQPFAAQLTATNPPVFVFQPKDCIVSPYGSAVFSAMASRLPPIYSAPLTTYQWYFNGVPLAGQTFPSLLIHGVTTNQAGTYSVTASNIGGVMSGGSATLTVVDTDPVPRLAVLPPNGSNLQFNLTGRPGRWYKIESSTDLQNWTNAAWLQLSNPTTLVSIQRLGPNHFVRASLDVPTDVCVAQLKQMRWAGKVWMIENQEIEAAAVNLSDIRPYVPIDSNGIIPFCPEGGIYSANWTVTNNPTCTLGLQGRGHVITGTHFPSGLIAYTIDFGGTFYADSFDSRTNLYSTGGQYDPMKATDHALIASPSLTGFALGGTAYVAGYVTARGGLVTASGSTTVGDFSWLNAHNKGIQPGHFTNNFNITFPPVIAPYGAGIPGVRIPTVGTNGAIAYDYMLGGGFYYSSNLAATAFGGTMYVARDSVLVVTGAVSLTQITFNPTNGAKLSLFLGAPSVTFAATLQNATSGQFWVYTLPSCIYLKLTGGIFNGVIYAPGTDLAAEGGASVRGAILARSFYCQGNFDFHLDDATGATDAEPFPDH
jgi:hypothetical protein